MFGFLLVPVKQIKKATVITWSSLKARISLSREFCVLSFDFFFAPYIFSVTHRIMLGRQGGKMCASAYEAYQVLRMCFKH